MNLKSKSIIFRCSIRSPEGFFWPNQDGTEKLHACVHGMGLKCEYLGKIDFTIETNLVLESKVPLGTLDEKTSAVVRNAFDLSLLYLKTFFALHFY